MLFSEYYGSYFRTVERIINEAFAGTLDRKRMAEIVSENAFEESSLTIPDALTTGEWPLITKEFGTPLRHTASMPLTLLEKQWLKALLADPRIRLFDVDETGLEDVEPLFDVRDIVCYDQYLDGDPYDSPEYQETFRLLLQALRERRRVEISYQSRRQQGRRHGPTVRKGVPLRLEYSEKDDKFRLYLRVRNSVQCLNLARVSGARLLEPFEPRGVPEEPEKKSVTLILTDKRNAFDRAMLQFSHYTRETVRLGPNEYRIVLQYEPEDETELLIQILAFGAVIRVEAPDAFVELIRERLANQIHL